MSDKDMIVNIVGHSGCGKTSLAKSLERLGYNIIHSFTTRPRREKYEWGHVFLDNLSDDFTVRKGKIIPNENVVAYKEVYSGIHYWAVREQFKGKGISIYVIDPDGALQIKQTVKDIMITTIFLFSDEATRIERMKLQERTRSEIDKRITSDREVFKTLRCDYAVDANNSLKEVLKEVLDIIRGEK